MALSFDEIWVYGGQLIVAQPLTTPKALGQGLSKIDWSSYIQGSLQVGAVDDFGEGDYPGTATVMVGRTDTKETPLALNTRGNVLIEGDSGTGKTLEITSGAGTAIDINGGTVWINDSGEAMFKQGTEGKTMSARFNESDGKPKPFDIQHPTKGKGHRLRYACIEGPEVGVYHRGRLRRGKEISLPYYWKNLVHVESITVQLQPVGAHQDIIVKRWDEQKIYLQSNGGLPIDCFFHVYGERKDINPLITEYEGKDCFDYPDPNFQPDAVNPRFDDPAFSGPPNTITS